MANELLDELMLADQDKTLTDVTVQEAQVISETQTPEATALSTLTEEELGKAKALSKSLDENNAQSVIEYGALAQKKIGDFSQSVLNKVQTKDLGDVGSALTDLMYQLQESNPNDLAAEDPGFFKKMFGKVKKSIFEVTQKYQKLGAGIDKISIKLSHEYKGLLDDNKTLETLYAENLDFFHALSVYIAGAELKIKELAEITIPQAQKDAESMADNAIAVQKISDLENYKNRLDKRQYDLKLARQITIQQAPQIRMIQNTNQELAEKIQTSINTAIPLWKNQVAIALTLLKQKDALTSQRIVSNTTNDLLTKNSEMLKQSSIEAARENERGVVDIETLKTTQANLIETIQETMTIQREGAIKRRQGEVELSQLEAEIKAKLLALSNKEKSE
ncbi:toxic anion resistance protein [Pseudolactococcus piscium]|nr:toxic anion resistance protein [Lactococcus piscium]